MPRLPGTCSAFCTSRSSAGTSWCSLPRKSSRSPAATTAIRSARATARPSCDQRMSAMLEPRQVKTIADAKAIVEQRRLTHVKVGVFDIDGILRGKYMSRAKFISALEHGYGFCDVVLGWDCQDQLYDNVKYTGWHTGYPDAPVKILPETCRAIPFEDNGLFFLSEFTHDAATICPRS